jgi:hypothetical protein
MYDEKYNGLSNKYNYVKNKIKKINDKIFNQKIKHDNIIAFIEKLEKCDKVITEFDEELWNCIVDKSCSKYKR